MRTNSRLRYAPTAAGLLLVVPALFAPIPVAAQDEQPQASTVDTGARMPGMILFSATDAQPMGMDEAEVKQTLKLMKHPLESLGDRAEFLWDYGFTFMTPRHEVATAEFLLSQYEVTNAQWKVFVDAKLNQAAVQTQPEETLHTLVARLFGIDPESQPAAAQAAGLYLYYRNAEALEPALNPDGDKTWEPLLSWVTETQMAAGLTIEFSKVLPPREWPEGQLPEADRDRPIGYVSWSDARAFCHWAGVHLPREEEWERGARGEGGRTFPWGPDWSVAAVVCKGWPGFESEPRTQDVNSLPDFATPEGLQHMLGNVSEYVFGFAREYEGSKSKFLFHNQGMLARGGSFKDEPYVMMAADRIWDMGTTQIGPNSRGETFGFRTASYPQPGCDLAMELTEYASEFDRIGGAAHWLPYPWSLSAKEATKPKKRQPLQGFALSRTSGWMERQIDADAAHFAYVTGPAKGIAFLPIKGVSDKEMKNVNALKRWSLAEDQTAFVGALLTTPDCTISLQDENGEPVTFDMSDINTDAWADHDLEFLYQVGLWLVLRGDKVAVFGGNGSSSGVHGRHLKGKPLGYLPANWEAVWAISAEARPEATMKDGVVTFSSPLPQLKKNGELTKGGKATMLTIHVPVTFK